jgi:hypothetical protein
MSIEIQTGLEVGRDAAELASWFRLKLLKSIPLLLNTIISILEFFILLLHSNEVTGEWEKLHNEELHDLYSSSSIIRIIKVRRVRWAGYVARMGEKRNVYRLLVGKPKGRRLLGKPRHMWLDNIRMDLVGVGWDVVDWIGLAQDRDRWRALVNSVLNLWVP